MNHDSSIVAFVNTHVIPMDREQILENQTVLVEGELITAVGAANEIAVPDGAEVIDGRGAYLMPGLADMHMHIQSIGQTFKGPDQLHLYLAQGVTTIRNLSALPEHLAWAQEVARGERLGPNMINGRLVVGLPDDLKNLGTIFRALVILTPFAIGLLGWLLTWLLFLLLGNETAFSAWAPFILPSLGVLLLLGIAAAVFKIIPLDIFTSRRFPFATIAENGREARRFVRQIKAAGYDFVKLYDYLSPKAYLGAADEARKLNFYAIGHLLDELSLEDIFAGGLREAAHVDEYMDMLMIGEASARTGFNEVTFDYDAIPQAAAVTKANDVLVLSNMVADETVYKLLEDPVGGLSQEKYTIVSAAVKETWLKEGRLVNWRDQFPWRRDTLQPFLMTLVKALYDQGVPLLIGTDIPVEGMLPEHIHRDLELLVEAGLTPYAALQAGTTNAAASVVRMGGQGNFGTVAAGQRADLILLEKNPLENVSNTRNRLGVMTRGRWFTAAELNDLVKDYTNRLSPSNPNP